MKFLFLAMFAMSVFAGFMLSQRILILNQHDIPFYQDPFNVIGLITVLIGLWVGPIGWHTHLDIAAEKRKLSSHDQSHD